MKPRFTNNEREKKTAYYRSIGHEWNLLELITANEPADPNTYSLESFTRDHYYEYTRQISDKTKEFVIEHSTWNIYPGISFDMMLDAATIYRNKFANYFQQDP